MQINSRNVVIGLLVFAVLWASGLAMWVVVTDSSGLSDRERLERCEEATARNSDLKHLGFQEILAELTEERDEERCR